MRVALRCGAIDRYSRSVRINGDKRLPQCVLHVFLIVVKINSRHGTIIVFENLEQCVDRGASDVGNYFVHAPAFVFLICGVR